MERSLCKARCVVFLLFFAGFGARAQAQVEYVDPTIGNIGILLEPTRPAVYLPNSMVRVYPIRQDATDDRIASFPLTISSHRQPELFSIMPGDGSAAAYDQEITTPYYYSVRFDGSLMRTEFTPTERAGYFRFTFPKGHAAIVVANRQEGGLQSAEKGVVTGRESVEGLTSYIFGEFSAPVRVEAGSPGKRGRLAVTAETKSLEFRYGVSFISVEQAEKNLRREIPDWGFDRVKDAAKARWNETLGRIAVEGGTEAQRRVFYTALYRCFRADDQHHVKTASTTAHSITRCIGMRGRFMSITGCGIRSVRWSHCRRC